MLIKVGTRGSKLALAQTNYVVEKLKKAVPENEYEIEIIKTKGDLDLSRPLDAIGSKGLFVDEIEDALLDGRIQLAVHSMKDMPDAPKKGLVFADAWTREDARDVLILRKASSLEELPEGAKIATGSKRRSYQLLKKRPDIKISPIRGNIDSRLRKLYEENPCEEPLDGIILAAAGLNRLGLTPDNMQYFSVEDMIPAPAQGRLAIEVAEANTELLNIVNALSDEGSRQITFLERGFLKAIGGDCHLPVGAYASKTENGFSLRALFGNEDGSKLACCVVEGEAANQELIDKAVEDIKKQLED
ncbi:MAG: hydroxymethylbilane synthase [Pseudobutyrivibrio sp.]|nr:hydroxymethylbilane synthase [Pseudobutyrivibrio sp.]